MFVGVGGVVGPQICSPLVSARKYAHFLDSCRRKYDRRTVDELLPGENQHPVAQNGGLVYLPAGDKLNKMVDYTFEHKRILDSEWVEKQIFPVSFVTVETVCPEDHSNLEGPVLI